MTLQCLTHGCNRIFPRNATLLCPDCDGFTVEHKTEMDDARTEAIKGIADTQAILDRYLSYRARKQTTTSIDTDEKYLTLLTLLQQFTNLL